MWSSLAVHGPASPRPETSVAPRGPSPARADSPGPARVGPIRHCADYLPLVSNAAPRLDERHRVALAHFAVDAQLAEPGCDLEQRLLADQRLLLAAGLMTDGLARTAERAWREAGAVLQGGGAPNR
jgi:hypothetical protein